MRPRWKTVRREVHDRNPMFDWRDAWIDDQRLARNAGRGSHRRRPTEWDGKVVHRLARFNKPDTGRYTTDHEI